MKIAIIAKITIGLGLIILISSAASSSAANNWKIWGDLRWQGLVEFSKGNLPGAKTLFEKALIEAKNVRPESENTVTSIYDIALVYDAESNIRQTQESCNEVLKLAKKICPDSGVQTLAIDSIQNIKAKEHDFNAVRELDDEIIKLNREHPGTECIAQAEIRTNGEIEVKAYSEPHTYTITPASDPDYRDLLMHIGPLRPKHPRPVMQWSKEETRL
jgi:hypothetical protein